MELNWRTSVCELMTITPTMARMWLQLHNKFNRDLKPSVVEQYVRDLLAGRWPLTHQGIGFDWNGQLIDGQHRLAAIAKANVSARMYVTTGLDPLSRSSVDTHSKRSAIDAFGLSGRQIRFGSVSTRSAAGMWSRMMIGMSGVKGRETRQELLEFEEHHAIAGRWTLAEFGKYPRYPYVQTSGVMAAVARGYYHIHDTHRLAQFVDVLSTGVMKTPDDVVAVHWRNTLSRPGTRGANSNFMGEIYGKTCRAIHYFLRRETVSKFYAPSEEPFPLPDQQATQTNPRLNRMAGDGGQLFSGRSSTPDMAEAPR